MTPKFAPQNKIILTSLLVIALILAALLVSPYLNSLHQQTDAILVLMQPSQQPNWMNASKLINTLLQLNYPVYLLSEPISAVSNSHRGDFILPIPQSNEQSIFTQYINYLSEQLNVTITSVTKVQANVYPINQPNVAVYYGGGVSGGSLEHIHALQQAGFILSTVDENNMNLQDLSKFNVLTFPGGGPYLNVLTEENTNSIKQFVQNGGGYLGTCGGSVLGFKLDLLDVDNFMVGDYPDWADLRGPLILNITDPQSLIVTGYQSNLTSTYYMGSFISRVGDDVDVICTYGAPTDELKEFGPEIIDAYNVTIQPEEINLYWGTPSIVAGEYGNGKVVLSTTHPELLAESQRLFVNSIFYLSSGNQTQLKTQEPATYQQTGTLQALNPDSIAQASQLLIQLHQEASIAQETMDANQELNYRITGATGDYLKLYVDDVDSRTIMLLNDLGNLTLAYDILLSSELASGPWQFYNGAEFSTEMLPQIINQILDLNNKLTILTSTSQQLSNQMQQLNQAVALNNTSQYYPTIIDLNNQESTTLYTLKGEVEYDLLNITFQMDALKIQLDFLDFQASQQ
ncbi:MAG: BPL-N domain-containing protein [Candidatus Bathyarchaeota archaeon]|nr:BPL-N domain-containing protein [Candidatus Bathyarchaeota archaeon]